MKGVEHTLATAKELYRFLDKLIPSELSCSWDNDGAMCMSDPDREVNRVLLSLDITMSAFRHAVDNGFDAIVSHHPLIFTPIKSISGCDMKSRIITGLMRGGISAFSFHTRLDALESGVNDALCSVLGLFQTEKYEYNGQEIGRIAHLPEEMDARSLAEYVACRIGSDTVTYTPCESVKKVFVVGGSGKDFVDAAIESGCEAFITGEVQYNALVDAADSGVCVICAGHFFTENPVLMFLEDAIKKFDKNIITEIYNSNPVKHI